MQVTIPLFKYRQQKRRAICLVGLPGSGKTTVARFLERICAAESFHLPKVVGHLYSETAREHFRRHAILFQGTEDVFLEKVDESPSSIVVLDGFLRSTDRLRILEDFATKKDWTVEIVYLSASGTLGLLQTAFRQVNRDLNRRMDLPRMYRKIRRDYSGLAPVLSAASDSGILIHIVDALKDRHNVEQSVRAALGFDLGSLSWDFRMLRILQSAAPDAWITGGGDVYRPFFNNRFGPPVCSWDVDINVLGESNARETRERLQLNAPEYRWHVKDVVSWSEKELGYQVSTVEDSFSRAALICTCAGVRLVGDDLEVHWGHPSAEPDLWNGILRPNEGGQIKFAQAKAQKIVEYYPAVFAPFIGHLPKPITLSYEDAMQKVQIQEKGGKAVWGDGMAPEERVLCDRILSLRWQLDKSPVAVPWPPPAPFPEGDPWVSEDPRFRVWLVNQVRSRNPNEGRNQYLKYALEVQKDREQKVTHQGWGLHLHAFHALLELETDSLPEYRKYLRLAMLWHDVGKLWSVHTPGAHPHIGAKKWASLHESCHSEDTPSLSVDEKQVISHMIRWHDIFGRLERGLWDAGYKGAMSPANVRKALKFELVPFAESVSIAKATWAADVSSVPMLRWLKQLADPLEELVRYGASP